MRRTTILGPAILCWVALGAAGCGGAAPGMTQPRAPAASPEEPSEPLAPPAPTEAGPAGDDAPGERKTAPAGQPAPESHGFGTTQSFDQLLDVLSGAEAVTLSAGKDCPGACRALRSMEKAADGICELAAESSSRCSAARQRVDAARDRVRAGCGDCT